MADYILFFTKSCQYVWNRPREQWTDDRAKEYQYVEPETGRRFMKVPIHAPGVRHGETGKPWRGMMPPPGKHWPYPPVTLDEMDARGEIFWSANGNPRRKVYLDVNPGVGVQDIWLEFRDAHNQNIKITGYPTEKNPELLRWIIESSSNPGDLVLDCFSGSGSTLAIAQELRRKWIGVDSGAEAIRTTLRRFAKGTELMEDFVSDDAKEQGVRSKEKNARRFLFEEVAHKPQLPRPPEAHSVIQDFVLWTESSKSQDAEAIVSKWKQDLRESHECQTQRLK